MRENNDNINNNINNNNKLVVVVVVVVVVEVEVVVTIITIMIIIMRVWGSPGSTCNLQPLPFLFFVAWRTRQVGARFDGEPSNGNDRSASRQREVLRGKQRVDSDYLSAGNVITRLSVIRIYGDSTTTLGTTRHDIQYLWHGYRSYKSSREDLST